MNSNSSTRFMWMLVLLRPHQAITALGCVAAGMVVTVTGPAVSFSTTAILGRTAPVVHLLGAMLALGGALMFTGVAKSSLPTERAGCLLQGIPLLCYGMLLLIANQWWAGPIITALAVAGLIKSFTIRRQLQEAVRVRADSTG